MAFTDIFKKKNFDEAAVTNDHKTLMIRRAKLLINELVSPLSKPNHKLIDELLQIISQTVILPSSLINKEEVLKTIKNLLLKIISPIPNPNKKLVEELLYIVMNPEESLVLNNIDKEKNIKSKDETKKEKNYESEDIKKQKTVINLILQQIKELINITNSLNVKIKSLEPRIESVESFMGQIKQKNEKTDQKLNDFEKNMEKFIGLYEVVTNQFNPFIESADTFSEEESNISSNDIDDKLNNLGLINETVSNVHENIKKVPLKKDLVLNGKIIVSLHDLEDELMVLTETKFIDLKRNILDWLKENKLDVADSLLGINDKKSFLKILLKAN